MAAYRRFSIPQKVAIVRLYTECEKNSLETSRRFAKMFPGESVTCQTIIDTNRKFDETGSVADLPRSGAPKTARTEANITLVRAAIEDRPTTSTRRMSAETGIGYRSVHRIFRKDLKIKSTIPTLCQKLNEDDPDRRVQFAEEFLRRVAEDPGFTSRVIWSDEANFKLNGHVNRHNAVFWSARNPHRTMAVAQQGPGLMVWCGIFDDRIIGPFFIEDGTVTGERYLRLLQEQLWPVVADHPQLDQLFFQHDGAQPHYALVVRQWLDASFPGRWIGRRGALEWPARSPDMTPPDFWLWGVIKENVYGRRPASVEQLRQFITEEIAVIDADMISHVTQSVVGRYERLIENGGEQLIK